jgi:hypothetical protein
MYLESFKDEVPPLRVFLLEVNTVRVVHEEVVQRSLSVVSQMHRRIVVQLWKLIQFHRLRTNQARYLLQLIVALLAFIQGSLLLV